ncbi:MAG: radical SAM protein [Terriglobales bacterium]
MSLRRSLVAMHRRFREAKMIVKGLVSTDHVVQAQIIPMRRCNLACGYCNEYDDHSKPVPLEEMYRRVDKLAELGTTLIVISGGEPLMHPEIEDIIACIRKHGIIAGMITNGYLLVPERIKKLNEAGLEHLQISIDNLQPDEISFKSLKVLDKKLEMLRQHAEFHVNINSVVGGGVKHPDDALVIARRAQALGFTSTVGIIHDGEGQLKPLDPESLRVFYEVRKLEKSSYARLNHFQEKIAHGEPNTWRCRSGSRYLYICENGLVHYCSQQRGFPGVPLAEYTTEDVKHEFRTEKYCAPNCTVSCVHQTSFMDFWRAPQKEQGFRPRPRKSAAPANGSVQKLVDSIQPAPAATESSPAAEPTVRQ